MKKLVTTLMLVAAMAVTGNVMAQDAKKATPDKPKTEKSEKKSCCMDTTKAEKIAQSAKTSTGAKKAAAPASTTASSTSTKK